MAGKQTNGFFQEVRIEEGSTKELLSIKKQISKLYKDGWLQIVLPGNELCFAKQNTPQLLQLLKAVGRQDLSLGRIYEGHINALLLIHLFASPKQKENWYADANDGCLFGVWNTGNNEAVELLQTDERSYVLSGKKTFASGAGIVNRALVTGNINNGKNKGWQMSVVNLDDLNEENIDYNSWKPLGMASSLSFTVDVTDCIVNNFELLGNANDYYKQPHFSAGSIRFCAVQLGGAEALLNETIVYLKSLHRVEDVFQNMRIAEMATELTSGDLWLQQAAKNWDDWVNNVSKTNGLIAFANMTRTAIERICLRVIELCSKCVGARGLMQPYGIEKRIRDLQFYLRQPAPDAAFADVAKYVIHSEKNIENLWNENSPMD